MKITSLTFSVALTFGSLNPALAQSTWTSGHGDIGVGYEDEGSGFELHPHWHLEGGVVDGTPRNDEEFDAGDLTLLVPNSANATAIRPASSDWAPIGVAAGETFWVLPGNSQPGVPYLGFATEELSIGDWNGDIAFTLSGLTGPGDVSVYFTSVGTPTFLWASSDGVTAADSFNLTPGVHNHYNVAFSTPGTYALDITVSGTHDGDGFKSSTETFTFTVVPEPSVIGLLALASIGAILFARRRRLA